MPIQRKPSLVCNRSNTIPCDNPCSMVKASETGTCPVITAGNTSPQNNSKSMTPRRLQKKAIIKITFITGQVINRKRKNPLKINGLCKFFEPYFIRFFICSKNKSNLYFPLFHVGDSSSDFHKIKKHETSRIFVISTNGIEVGMCGVVRPAHGGNAWLINKRKPLVITHS